MEQGSWAIGARVVSGVGRLGYEVRRDRGVVPCRHFCDAPRFGCKISGEGISRNPFRARYLPGWLLTEVPYRSAAGRQNRCAAAGRREITTRLVAGFRGWIACRTVSRGAFERHVVRLSSSRSAPPPGRALERGGRGSQGSGRSSGGRFCGFMGYLGVGVKWKGLIVAAIKKPAASLGAGWQRASEPTGSS